MAKTFSRKSKKRTFKKRRTARRVARRIKNQTPKLRDMVSFGLGLPRKCIVNHRYVSTLVLTSTAGAMAKQTFSANGMFDPDITLTGHQPLYYDQFGALYNHYIVVGSKITIKVCPGTTNEAAAQIVLMLNDDTNSSNITDPDHAFEQSQHSNMTLIPPNSNNTFNLSKTFSAKKVFGGSILANPDLQGLVGSNPSEQSYFDVFFASVGSANTTCAIQVLIEYTAIWRELKEIAQS